MDGRTRQHDSPTRKLFGLLAFHCRHAPPLGDQVTFYGFLNVKKIRANRRYKSWKENFCNDDDDRASAFPGKRTGGELKVTLLKGAKGASKGSAEHKGAGKGPAERVENSTGIFNAAQVPALVPPTSAA